MFRGDFSYCPGHCTKLEREGKSLCMCSKSTEWSIWGQTASCSDHSETPSTVKLAQVFPTPDNVRGELNGGSPTWAQVRVPGKREPAFPLHLITRGSTRIISVWGAWKKGGWLGVRRNECRSPLWCCPQGGVCESRFWGKFNMVSLKFKGIWGRTMDLETSSGPVEQPCQWGLKRPWHEVTWEKKGEIPIPYPSLPLSEDVEHYP